MLTRLTIVLSRVGLVILAAAVVLQLAMAADFEFTLPHVVFLGVLIIILAWLAERVVRFVIVGSKSAS